MLSPGVISMVVPVVAGVACLALRGRLPFLAADVRGIALQTVIIMVVLLAIAGGVAAVLLNRGGEAVTDIERQQISRQASEFKGSALCEAAGFDWWTASKTCNAAARNPASAYTTEVACNSSPEGYGWVAAVVGTPPVPAHCA